MPRPHTGEIWVSGLRGAHSLSVRDSHAVAPVLNPAVNDDCFSDDERHDPERLAVFRRLRTAELCQQISTPTASSHDDLLSTVTKNVQVHSEP